MFTMYQNALGKKNHLFSCLNNLDKYVVWWSYGSNKPNLADSFFLRGLRDDPLGLSLSVDLYHGLLCS